MARKSRPVCKSSADAIVFLRVVFNAAEKKRRPQHEQRVGDDRAGNGRLHEHELPGAQGGERDDHSVRFPSVALSRPPTVSPVLAATDSVA